MNENKLVISDFYKKHMLGFQLEGNVLRRIFDFGQENIVGNIYCGYIKDVVKNINAAFVAFDDKKGYLTLSSVGRSVKEGDKILIQVSADKIKTKDYLLTTHINLKEKDVILTVGNTDLSISKKIRDRAERERLKEIFKPYLNDEFGFILRTSSENISNVELIAEVEKLTVRWDDIKKKYKYSRPGEILQKKEYLIQSCLEYAAKFKGNIITDSDYICDSLLKHGIFAIKNTGERVSLQNKYSLMKHLNESLGRKVYLKSGGCIIIDYTEAMTVIDVNTGKADCRTDREKTFLKINCEAAKEIARQIAVRNISGIIIIDFINLSAKDDYTQLRAVLAEAAEKDFSQCSVVGFTALGLMELTRKKAEKPLYEIFKRGANSLI